jgi:hypothetical protein
MLGFRRQVSLFITYPVVILKTQLLGIINEISHVLPVCGSMSAGSGEFMSCSKESGRHAILSSCLHVVMSS